jgi:hypothetical protein
MIIENVFLFGFKGVMKFFYYVDVPCFNYIINKSKKMYIIYILIITVIVVQNNFFK